jgi:hypothetical protein
MSGIEIICIMVTALALLSRGYKKPRYKNFSVRPQGERSET